MTDSGDRPKRPGGAPRGGRPDAGRPPKGTPPAGRKPQRSDGPRRDDAAGKPFRDRADKPFRDRDERPARSRDERSPRERGERPFRDRADKPFRDRDERPARGRDERSPRERGERPFRDRADRPYRERGDTPFRDRPRHEGAGRPEASARPRRDDSRGGDRKPRAGAPGRGQEAGERRRPVGGDRRGEHRVERPGPEYRGEDTRSVRPRIAEPALPDDVQAKDLDRVARNELKTLSKDNADAVARHLAMVARLFDEDPQSAHQHALAAARRAGRIGVVRETLAITAYATGDYALALRELRTYRRITGRDDQLPMMVDSERGLGRPERALELGRSVSRQALPVAVQVELAIAMSGARLDLGQVDEALGELQIPQLDPTTAYPWSPGLFDAYATVLEDLGRHDDARVWWERSEVASAALAEASHPEEEDIIEISEEEIAQPGLPDHNEPDDNEPDDNEPGAEAAASDDAAGRSDGGDERADGAGSEGHDGRD